MARIHIRHLTVPDLFPPPGYAHGAVATGARLILTAGAVWKVVQASPLAPAASTLLGVALLGYRGQLVEIEAVAALP